MANMKNIPHEHGALDRRDFLRLAGLGTGYLLVPLDLIEALEPNREKAAPHAAPPAYAAFHPLQPEPCARTAG